MGLVVDREDCARRTIMARRGIRRGVGCIALLVGGALWALSGCVVPASIATVIPSPSGLTAPAKSPDCHIDVFWTRPDRPYRELAAIRATPYQGPSITTSLESFQDALRSKACELGGDAVIVQHPFSSTEAIAVKYRDIPTSPP